MARQSNFIIPITAIFLGACGRPSSGSLFAEGTPTTSQEDAAFDSHIESPEDLLQRFYRESRILVLETSNHTTFKRYAMLKKLLESMSNSESPRYIVLERFHDNDTFYQDLSEKPLSALNFDSYFPTQNAKTTSLCDPEWAYSVAQFMPAVQQINAARNKNKIKVTSIDGMSDAVSLTWPWDGQAGTMSQYHLAEGTCSYKSGIQDFPFMPILVASGTRENMTEKNFENLYTSLSPKDKIILVYHHAHTVNSFDSCMPFMDDASDLTNWTSKKEPLAWLARFLNSHPEARGDMKMVLLDEKDPDFNPSGVLKFSARQASRHANTSFAVDLNNLKGILPEVGMDVSVGFDGGSILNPDMVC